MSGDNDNEATGEVIGGNAKAQLESYARRISEGLDKVAEGQEAVKLARAEAKADGYDLKALNACVKEMRKGAKHQVAQLELELVVGTYRRALGLPTDLETAQRLAAQEAGEVPEPKRGQPAAGSDDDADEKPKRKRPERKDLN